MSSVAASGRTPGTGGRVRVLLADDALEVRTLTRDTLEGQGFEVVGEATNGAEAIALVQAHKPDVLLLDVAMPVMDGLDTLVELQRVAPGLPVVMHSGFSQSALGERCLSAGAVAYTEKGLEPSLLSRILRDAAVGVAARQGSAGAASPAPRRTLGIQASGESAPSVLGVSQPAIVLVAAAMFISIFLLRLAAGPAGDAMAIGVLYALPVSLLAARFGVRGGLAGVVVATLLLVGHNVVGGANLGLAGFATRIVAYLTIGLAVGVSADRVQRLLAFEKQAAAAIVSANRQLVEALERSRSSVTALEAANADLRQFGYVVSHDLAEPLRSMSGFSSLLESDYADQLDERGLRYLGFIRDGALRMRTLIDDLRSYTHAGQQDLARGPVDLDQIVADVLQGLSVTLTERSAVVEADDLPVVVGDRSMLTVVMQNLISNGIKFNNSERPRVQLTASSSTDGWAVIDVADNGIGIPAEHATRVFGLFSRLHTREQYPGTGLGLAIVKRVVERHGGRIEIVPASSGTTFRLTLPSGGTPRPEDS